MPKKSSGKKLTPTQRRAYERRKAAEREARGYKGFTRPGRAEELDSSKDSSSKFTRAVAASQSGSRNKAKSYSKGARGAAVGAGKGAAKRKKRTRR